MPNLTDDQWERMKRGLIAAFQVLNEVEPEEPEPPPPPVLTFPLPPTFQPSSKEWMTEEEEILWYQSLGFSCTVKDLRESYNKFIPSPKKPTTNPMNETETDDLRNYFRLYVRTGYQGFLTQATMERDWQVQYYSRIGVKGTSIDTSHVYLMGLTDWIIAHPEDGAAKDAANRILGFIKGQAPVSYIETRIIARMLLCLCYWKEKMGDTGVDPTIARLINAIHTAPVYNGWLSFPKYYQGQNAVFDDQPLGNDLRVTFPKNALYKSVDGTPLVVDATHYNLRPFPGVASFQDCFLMHALQVAARVQKDSSLGMFAVAQAKAWEQVCGFPWNDSVGSHTNEVIGYNVVSSCPEPRMFQIRAAASTPLYVTQFSAFCVNPGIRFKLQRQAVLRGYGQYDKIDVAKEITGQKPKYWLWQSYEQGFFLTQK